MKPRSLAFDAARALAALYIVGFHHVLDYSPFLKRHTCLEWDEAATTGCLAFFFFCSSYLVSRHTEIKGVRDAIRFWKRRCIRILPLYFLALFSLSRPAYLTLLSAVGLNNFIPNIDGRNIPTLWFVSQLLLFYLLYPLLRGIRNKLSLCSICVLVELAFLAGWTEWGWDHRLWLYFPLYATGILVSRWEEIRLLRVSVLLSMGFAGLVFSQMATSASFFTAFCGCGAVFFLADRLSRIPRSFIVFRATSYASMAAYLFHRKELYRLIRIPIRWFGPEIQNRPGFLLWMYLGFIPVVFVSGWFIQYGYDRILSLLAGRAKPGASTIGNR